MAKAYGDDLRRKFLSAYDEGAGTLEDLAERFVVSLGWAKKISAQRNRTGRAERVRHQPGRRPKAGAEAEKQVIAWVLEQPDLTLAELSAKLNREASVVLSRGRVWYLVRRLGLRLKKKSLRARERDTEVHLKRREQFAVKIVKIALKRLIFLDESGVTTSMTRLYARALPGQPMQEATPGGHWKIMTILGAMSLRLHDRHHDNRSCHGYGNFPGLC